MVKRILLCLLIMSIAIVPALFAADEGWQSPMSRRHTTAGATCDRHGNVLPLEPTIYTKVTLSTNSVTIATQAGRIYGVILSNSDGSAQYLTISDTGTVLIPDLYAGAGASVVYDLSTTPIVWGTWLQVVSSSPSVKYSILYQSP